MSKKGTEGRDRKAKGNETKEKGREKAAILTSC